MQMRQMGQTRNWLLFTIAWFIIMLLLIPPKRGLKLSPFGFCLGFGQAVILAWLAMGRLKLWKIPGDIMFSGIPVFTSISWIPPAILFVNYYPASKSWFYKAAYILFFAAGTALVQHGQRIAGMWENIRWKDIYTFPLALLTHTIMSLSRSLFLSPRNQ